MLMLYSRTLIVRHFVDLRGVELSKCQTTGSIGDIFLVFFHPSTVNRPTFKSLATLFTFTSVNLF